MGGGRIGLSPLSINRDELAEIGELLSDKNDGVLYMKLNDGNIIPIKGDSYFRFKTFYERFWNTGDNEPEESDSYTWLNTSEYENEMEDLEAVLMIQQEDDNGNLQWNAFSPHSKASSVLVDEETSEYLDRFINRHNDFYNNIFDLSGQKPDLTNPDQKRHWIDPDGFDMDTNIRSGAVMVYSEEEGWIGLSQTVLAKDVIVDLENGHNLEEILPMIHKVRSDLNDFIELKDDIRIAAGLEPRVESLESGYDYLEWLIQCKIDELRSELTELINENSGSASEETILRIDQLESDIQSLETALKDDINKLDSRLRSLILDFQYDLNEISSDISDHATSRLLETPVHGMRVTDDKLEYRIANDAWVSVLTTKDIGEDNGVASLNEYGVVPPSQLPGTLTPYFHIVGDIDERTELDPKHGDEAFVLSNGRRYVWNANDNIWIRREVDAGLFEISWGGISNKPDTFTPSSHGNEAHGEDFVKDNELKNKIEELGIVASPFMNTWGGM